MNERKIIKFNLYVSFVLLCILIVVLVATTVAYFSRSKQVTNTFTAGSVDIVLSEAAVKRTDSGDLVEDSSQKRILGGADATIKDYGRVYPGQSIFKDPTIINTGSNSEWIAAKVILTDGKGNLTKIMGYEGYEDIDIEILLSGGLLDETVHFGMWNGIKDVCHNDRCAMIQVADAQEGTYEFFFLMLEPIKPGESVVVFDHVTFPEEWTNKEMQELSELTIHVQAFGVQLTDFNNCLEATTTAFPEHFKLK